MRYIDCTRHQPRQGDGGDGERRQLENGNVPTSNRSGGSKMSISLTLPRSRCGRLLEAIRCEGSKVCGYGKPWRAGGLFEPANSGRNRRS